MTIENDYQELIYAFAFGCLELDEQSEFLDKQNKDPNFNWTEFGEYQNLAALLPSILTIENPEADVKARVAQKLYSFKDEIKAKKKNIVSETIENETNKQGTFKDIEASKTKSTTIEEIKTTIQKGATKENTKVDNEEFEAVTHERKTKEIFKPSQATQINGRDFKSFLEKKKKTIEGEIPVLKEKLKTKEKQEKDKVILPDDGIKLEEEKPAEKKEKVIKEGKPTRPTYIPYRERKKYTETKTKNYSPVIFLLFLLIIVGVIWLYLSNNSKIKQLQQNVNKLTYQVSSLTSSFKKNKELQEILTTKNVQLVNLIPTKRGSKSYGRLIISFDKNKSFFQMFNMPRLEKSMSYQLWVNVSRSYFSLGVFIPKKIPEYHPFKLPQLSGKRTIRFLVTKETKLGAERPGKLIYLKGKL